MWQYPEIQLTIWNIILSVNTSKNVKHFCKVQIQGIFIIINLLPWDCSELLFQCLNVSELDSLPASSCFDDLALKEKKQNKKNHH